MRPSCRWGHGVRLQGNRGSELGQRSGPWGQWLQQLDVMSVLKAASFALQKLIPCDLPDSVGCSLSSEWPLSAAPHL